MSRKKRRMKGGKKGKLTLLRRNEKRQKKM